MSGRPRGSRKGSEVVQPSTHSKEELQDLEDFCHGLQIDEVSLDDWIQVHESLDLTIPLNLSRADLHEGDQEIKIQWTRSIRERSNGPTTRTRESKSVIVPSQTRNGDVMVFKGLGDKIAEASGDLRIIIHVK